jgi:hypothetical protein
MAGFLAHATACELHLGKLLALRPSDTDAMRSLVSAYARRGVYYLERDRSEESARLALEPLQKWSALAERLSAMAPDDAGLGGALGESRSYLGLAYQRAREPARAIDVLRRSTEDDAPHGLNPRDEHWASLLNSAALASVLLSQRDARRQAGAPRAGAVR